MSGHSKDINQKFEHAYQLHRKGDYKAAYNVYLELAELGYSNCQAYIGGLYYSGNGVDKDFEMARYWLENAAANNEPNAQFLLGKMDAREGNYDKAISWYEQAGKRGYMPALYKLAIYSEKGRIGPPDIKRAMELYRQTAESGHLYAQRTLAFRLLRGRGGFSGFFEGFKWLYRMLRNGYKLGMEDDYEDNVNLKV